jgi:hypothetical protein
MSADTEGGDVGVGGEGESGISLIPLIFAIPPYTSLYLLIPPYTSLYLLVPPYNSRISYTSYISYISPTYLPTYLPVLHMMCFHNVRGHSQNTSPL